VLEYLLANNINVNNTDTRGQTPINFAVRYNKTYIKELLIKHGATPPVNQKQKQQAAKSKAQAPVAPKAKVNERLIPKEFVLQILDNGTYRPITELEFELLKKQSPDIAELFES
jgi:ankyrin repeat protein